MVLEIISGIFLITGSTFMLIASIGILRFPDFLMRMHASTKAGSLGASTLVIGAALMFPTTEVFTRAITTIIFILLTAPLLHTSSGERHTTSGLKSGRERWWMSCGKTWRKARFMMKKCYKNKIRKSERERSQEKKISKKKRGRCRDRNINIQQDRLY